MLSPSIGFPRNIEHVKVPRAAKSPIQMTMVVTANDVMVRADVAAACFAHARWLPHAAYQEGKPRACTYIYHDRIPCIDLVHHRESFRRFLRVITLSSPISRCHCPHTL